MPSRSAPPLTSDSLEACRSHANTSPRFSISIAMPKDFDPGQAQTSAARIPGRASSASTASCDASSCTKNSPSSKPGSSRTAAPRGRRIPVRLLAVGCASKPACCSAASSFSLSVRTGLTRRVRGGGVSNAFRNAVAFSFPRSASRRSASPCETEYRTASHAARSSSPGRGSVFPRRISSRRTALTYPAVLRLASATVSFTAAWSGTRSRKQS